MKAIAGIIKREANSLSPEEIEWIKPTSSNYPFDFRKNAADKQAALWCCGYDEKKNQKKHLFPFQNSRYILVADGGIYNSKALAQKLFLKSKDVPLSQVIISAYEKWGEKFAEYLRGDFGIALWDKKTKKLYAVRDQFGIKPFYYYKTDNYIIFSNIPTVILRFPGINIALSKHYLYESLLMISPQNDRSVFQEIRKIPPAHYLMFGPKNTKIESYWELQKGRAVYLKNEEEYHQAFEEKLKNAIQKRNINPESTGFEIHGDLESAILCGIYQRENNNQFQTFTHYSDQTLNAEPEASGAIKQLSGYLQNKDNHYISVNKLNLLDLLKSSVTRLGFPHATNYHVFSDIILKSARQHGIKTLNSGFGGNLYVSFSEKGYWNELAKDKKWPELWQELQSNTELKKYQKVRHFMGKYLKDSMPAVYDMVKKIKPNYNFSDIEHDYYTTPLKNDILEDEALKSFYTYQHIVPEYSMINDHIMHFMRKPSITWHVELSTLDALYYDIDYKYPLLDADLMEYFLAVPAPFKIRNGWGQFLLRKTAEKYIPQDIAWQKHKNDIFSSLIREMIQFNYDEIMDFIKSSHHSFVDEFIDREKLITYTNNSINTSLTFKHSEPEIVLNALKIMLFLDQPMIKQVL